MPAILEETIVVEGLSGLQRAFRRAGRDISKDLRSTLQEAAEPVRVDAEALARSSITRIGVPWSEMRVGVTSRSVYLAPKRRSRASRRNAALRRPNLASLLLNRSMIPAVRKNERQITDRVESLLHDFAVKWGQDG